MHTRSILIILAMAYSFMNLAQDLILEFVIMVPSYNNEALVKKNLDSIVRQITKHHFNILYINDHSTDQTGSIVDTYIRENKLEHLIRVIHNEKRVGALENIYNAVHASPDHSHIIIVDGDDALAHDHVIERVAQEYLLHDTWITYGDFVFDPRWVPGATPKLPQQEIVDQDPYYFRKNGGQSHLRTFKASLFKKIKKEDLMYEGQFLQMAGDTAQFVPMLEMSSKGHIAYIAEVLYLYYWQSPLCDHNLDRTFQQSLDSYVRSKNPYAPLNSLEDEATYVS